jgi:transposase InsO family protein
LVEVGIKASVGTTEHSYENALAETINGLYKTELIHHRVLSNTKAAVEMTTLEWVAWFNNKRLLGSIGYIPPAEAEQKYYRQQHCEALESAVL